jgi:hypothetical protein
VAKPDCDDGWLKYAHELDAALACANFSKGARIVLHEVFGQVFGPAKLRTATLSPTAVGRRVGMDKGNVGHAIRELTDSNALPRAPGPARYRFNKNYEEWTKDGQPRLTPDEVRYCRSAPARAMSYVNDPAVKPVVYPDNASENPALSNDTTVVHPDNGRVVYPDNETLSIQTTESAPPLRTPLVGDLRIKTIPAPAPARAGGDSGHSECVELARSLRGDDGARLVAGLRLDILRSVAGDFAKSDPEKLACYAAALREVKRRTDRGTHVQNFHALALSIAKHYAHSGIPGEPLSVAPPEPPGETEADREALHRKLAEDMRDYARKERERLDAHARELRNGR